MGSVYLASDSMLANEEIAIKVLHAELCRNQKHTQRFLREVQLTRKVTHPNVVRTFDVGNEGGRLFFTMEFAPGATLKEKLHAGNLDCYEAAGILREVAKGLFAIHQVDIIHRDLKPGNIIITPDGFVKITDFGVAKPGVSDLTGHNEIIGSIPYMAPEVWVGRGVTAQADLYALGVVAYEMLTGVLPFEGDSPAELMCKHLEQRPVAPKELKPDLPEWLNTLILQLLEKDASRRPDGAKTVVEVINRYLDADNTPLPHSNDELKIKVPEPEPYTPSILHGFTDIPASLDRAPEVFSAALEICDTHHARQEYVAMPERRVVPDLYDYADYPLAKRVVLHVSVFTAALILCAAYIWRFEASFSPWAQGLVQITKQMQVMKGAVWALLVNFGIHAPLFAMPIFLITALRRNFAAAFRTWMAASVLTLCSIVGVFAVFWCHLRFGGLRVAGSSGIHEILSSMEAALVYSAELSLLIPQGTVLTPVVHSSAVLYEPVMEPLWSQQLAYWVSLAIYLGLLTRFVESRIVRRGVPSLRFKILCLTGCGLVPVTLQLAALHMLPSLQLSYATRDLHLVAGPIDHLFDHYSITCAAMNWLLLGILGCWVLPAISNRVKQFRDARQRLPR